MDVFFIIWLFIIIFSSKFCKSKFNYDFLDRKTTLCINGIFVILVLLRHSTDYCIFSSKSSSIFNFVDRSLEQLIVTTFLFYSGYGIYESIKTKENYINKKLMVRTKKLYLNFAVVVSSFFIINILLNIKYDIKTIIGSFFAWETIGNSNWYMFAIFSMYLLTFYCFKIFKNHKNSIIAITLLFNLYCIILSIFKESYWYNTIICFIFGLWFSYYKDNITKLLTKNNFIYSFLIIVFNLYFYIFLKFKFINSLFYGCWSLSFIILIILLSLKFKIHSKILLFFGKYTFWIYSLQRLPMIVLSHFNVNNYNKYLFLVLSFFITIILSVAYSYIFEKEIIKVLICKNLKNYTTKEIN